MKFTIHSMTAEDDRVAIEAESYGEHASGKTYNNHYHFLMRLRDGKIVRFTGVLTEQYRVGQAELDAIDKDVQAQVQDAVTFAETSPWPTHEELFQDVYVRSPYVHAKTADKDPAWRAAQKDDRVPESFAPWVQPAAPAKVES